MNVVEQYCNSIQRKSNRLVKKMFGFSDMKTALQDLKIMKSDLEKFTGKGIDDIMIEDVKSLGNGCYVYARYRTLKRITDLYLDSVSLKFNSNELEVYSK